MCACVRVLVREGYWSRQPVDAEGQREGRGTSPLETRQQCRCGKRLADRLGAVYFTRSDFIFFKGIVVVVVVAVSFVRSLVVCACDALPACYTHPQPHP